MKDTLKLSNEQLVARIQSGGDVSQDIKQLWDQNQGLVNIYVRRYSRRAEEEDLHQESYIALCDAIDNYRPDRGTFITYYGYWLRSRLGRYCDRCSSTVLIPINKLELLQKVRKVNSEYQQIFFREPTRKELCCIMGISQKEIDQILLVELAVSRTSLDQPVSSLDDESLILLETIPSSDDVEAEAIENELQREMEEAVHDVLETLPAHQKEAITLVYLDNMSRYEAGKVMDLSQSQIATLIDKGFRKIRRRPDRLKPYISDIALSIAYHGTYSSFKNTRTSSTERAALHEMKII